MRVGRQEGPSLCVFDILSRHLLEVGVCDITVWAKRRIVTIVGSYGIGIRGHLYRLAALASCENPGCTGGGTVAARPARSPVLIDLISYRKFSRGLESTSDLVMTTLPATHRGLYCSMPRAISMARSWGYSGPLPIFEQPYSPNSNVISTSPLHG